MCSWHTKVKFVMCSWHTNVQLQQYFCSPFHLYFSKYVFVVTTTILFCRSLTPTFPFTVQVYLLFAIFRPGIPAAHVWLSNPRWRRRVLPWLLFSGCHVVSGLRAGDIRSGTLPAQLGDFPVQSASALLDGSAPFLLNEAGE